MKHILTLLFLLLTVDMGSQVIVSGQINIGSSLEVFWNSSAGATSYNVKRGPTGGPYTTVDGGETNQSYVDSNIQQKTQYCYVVTAVNSIGESANSTEACGVAQ